MENCKVRRERFNFAKLLATWNGIVVHTQTNTYHGTSAQTQT